MSISLCVVVCNEAGHLAQLVHDTRPWVDEVVVVVQESQDETLAVARELADTVVEHPCHGYSEPSYAAAVEASSGEWVLVLDADERLSGPAKLLLRSWATGPASAYALRRWTTVDGVTLEDAHHLRFFRREAFVPPPHIHAGLRTTGDAETIGGLAIHHHKTSIEQSADDLRYREIMGDAYPGA